MRLRFPQSLSLALDRGTSNDVDISSSADVDLTNHKVMDKKTAGLAGESSDDGSEKVVDPDAQRGVQLAEAMTEVWTRRDLIMAYVL